MDVSEIDKEIARLEKLKAEAMEAEKEKQRVAEFEEAKEVMGRLLVDINRIYDLGYCPPRLLEALKDGTGKFAPGTYIKRPKAPREPKYHIDRD